MTVFQGLTLKNEDASVNDIELYDLSINCVMTPSVVTDDYLYDSLDEYKKNLFSCFKLKFVHVDTIFCNDNYFEMEQKNELLKHAYESFSYYFKKYKEKSMFKNKIDQLSLSQTEKDIYSYQYDLANDFNFFSSEVEKMFFSCLNIDKFKIKKIDLNLNTGDSFYSVSFNSFNNFKKSLKVFSLTEYIVTECFDYNFNTHIENDQTFFYLKKQICFKEKNSVEKDNLLQLEFYSDDNGTISFNFPKDTVQLFTNREDAISLIKNYETQILKSA